MAASALLVTMNACNKDDIRTQGNVHTAELVLSPSVDGVETRAAMNYAADDYFTTPGFGQAEVFVGMTSAVYDYDASAKTLRAAGAYTPYYFPTDGSGLTFKASWPTETQRSAIDAAFPTDQSTREAFLTADYLSVTTKAYASAKVPVRFQHEHSKAAFTFEGTTLYGKRIEKLVFNGYTAYCDPACDDAQLIFKPLSGQYIFQAGKSGALKIEGDDALYTFTLGNAVIGFDAGSHHTIKLNVNH